MHDIESLLLISKRYGNLISEFASTNDIELKSISCVEVQEDKVQEIEKDKKSIQETAQDVTKKVKARRQTIGGLKCLVTSENLVYLESTKELMGTWCEDNKSIVPMEDSDSEEESDSNEESMYHPIMKVLRLKLKAQKENEVEEKKTQMKAGRQFSKRIQTIRNNCFPDRSERYFA